MIQYINQPGSLFGKFHFMLIDDHTHTGVIRGGDDRRKARHDWNVECVSGANLLTLKEVVDFEAATVVFNTTQHTQNLALTYAKKKRKKKEKTRRKEKKRKEKKEKKRKKRKEKRG